MFHSSELTLSQTGYVPENMLNIKLLSILCYVLILAYQLFAAAFVCSLGRNSGRKIVMKSILIFHSTYTKKKTESPDRKEMQGNANKIRIFQNKEFWQEEEILGNVIFFRIFKIVNSQDFTYKDFYYQDYLFDENLFIKLNMSI